MRRNIIEALSKGYFYNEDVHSLRDLKLRYMRKCDRLNSATVATVGLLTISLHRQCLVSQTAVQGTSGRYNGMVRKASLLNLCSTFANLAEKLALAFNRHVETQMMESTYETSHQISAHPLGSHWSSVISDLFFVFIVKIIMI